MSQARTLTRLLDEWSRGDREALDTLFPLVYDDLQRIAHAHLRRRSGALTLGTRGVVHEAYLHLLGREHPDLTDRAHFYAVASKVMRHILIDYSRRKHAQKRGEGRVAVTLDDDIAQDVPRLNDLIALDEALEQLAARDQRLSDVVECRCFGGLTVVETAEALGTSVRTVERDWTRAKAYLKRLLSE